jgi:meso-butanediol dehydrogenase/(S,S)-butanediol dehydrogenase/diacetyl reductase
MVHTGALSEKVVVITGAGSGVGRAVAKAVGRQGASVVVADFDGPKMERTVEEVLRLGTAPAAIALAADVRSDGSVRSLARDAVKSMGRVDIVINAAGVLLQGKLDRISTHDWTWMLETNLLGAVRTATTFMPYMTDRRSGHLVNIISYGGLHPGYPLTIPYDSGHAALAAFTEALALQLHDSGVAVSLFCLGGGSPRIGVNTRTRGIGRWIGTVGPEEATLTVAQLADALVDGLHNRRFLIAGDQSDLPFLEQRYEHVERLLNAEQVTS